MIRSLKNLLQKFAEQPGSAPDPERVPLAMAALLVEAARADFHVNDAELDELVVRLTGQLDLSEIEARELLHRARSAVEHSVSLHEFTRPLHEALEYGQKEDLIRMLWHVAFADRHLDKYEDYLISKVAELLYVSRGDVLRLKHEALQTKPAATGGD
jgi:uncharacterized tellurite resistance protein B-like protein